MLSQGRAATSHLVALAGIHIGHDQKQARLHGVRDPQLLAVEDIGGAIRRGNCSRLQRKRVASRCGLGQTEGAHHLSGQLGQVLVAQLRRGEFLPRTEREINARTLASSCIHTYPDEVDNHRVVHIARD